jgi:hypothetical protein
MEFMVRQTPRTRTSSIGLMIESFLDGIVFEFNSIITFHCTEESQMSGSTEM